MDKDTIAFFYRKNPPVFCLSLETRKSENVEKSLHYLSSKLNLENNNNSYRLCSSFVI